MAEPLRAPISLSRYDHEHDTDQKTVTMFMDFWPCPAELSLGQLSCIYILPYF